MAYNYIYYDGIKYTDLKRSNGSYYYRVYLKQNEAWKLMYERQNNLNLSILGGKVDSASFDYITTDNGRQDFVIYTLTKDWRNAENWSNGAATGVSVYNQRAEINTTMDSASLKSALQPLSFVSDGIVVIGEKSTTANSTYNPICDVNLLEYKLQYNANIWECFQAVISPVVIQDFVYPLELYANVHYNPAYFGWNWNFSASVVIHSNNQRTLASYYTYHEGDQGAGEYPRVGGQIKDDEKGIIRDAADSGSPNIKLSLDRNRRCKVTYGYGQSGYAGFSVPRMVFTVEVV